MEKQFKFRVRPLSLRKIPFHPSFDLLIRENPADNSFFGVIKNPPRITEWMDISSYTAGYIDISYAKSSMVFSVNENTNSEKPKFLFVCNDNGNFWYRCTKSAPEFMGVFEISQCQLSRYEQETIIAAEDNLFSKDKSLFSELKKELLPYFIENN